MYCSDLQMHYAAVATKSKGEVVKKEGRGVGERKRERWKEVERGGGEGDGGREGGRTNERERVREKGRG